MKFVRRYTSWAPAGGVAARRTDDERMPILRSEPLEVTQ